MIVNPDLSAPVRQPKGRPVRARAGCSAARAASDCSNEGSATFGVDALGRQVLLFSCLSGEKGPGAGHADKVPRPKILFSLSLKDNFDPPSWGGWNSHASVARKNSPLLFRLFNRGNLGRWPNRRALQSRQNPGVEQGNNRRLLVLVMPFLRPLFRWIFLELTGRKIFLRKKKSAGIFVASMGQSSGRGRREASPSSQMTGFGLGFCRASKALLGVPKLLFLLCFPGSKKSRRFGARASSPHGRR
jgi:hypothetical protein